MKFLRFITLSLALIAPYAYTMNDSFKKIKISDEESSSSKRLLFQCNDGSVEIDRNRALLATTVFDLCKDTDNADHNGAIPLAISSITFNEHFWDAVPRILNLVHGDVLSHQEIAAMPFATRLEKTEKAKFEDIENAIFSGHKSPSACVAHLKIANFLQIPESLYAFSKIFKIRMNRESTRNHYLNYLISKKDNLNELDNLPPSAVDGIDPYVLVPLPKAQAPEIPPLAASMIRPRRDAESPDGMLKYTENGIINTSNNKNICALDEEPLFLRFSSDGRKVMVCPDSNRLTNEIRVIEIDNSCDTAGLAWRVNGFSSIHEIVFDSNILCVLGYPAELLIIGALSGTTLRKFKIDSDYKPELILSPHNDMLLLRDLYRQPDNNPLSAGAFLINLKNNTLLQRFRQQSEEDHRIVNVDFTQDGKNIVIQRHDKDVEIYDCTPLNSPCIDESSSDKMLHYNAEANTIINAATNEIIHSLTENPVLLRFSPKNAYAAYTTQSGIALVNLANKNARSITLNAFVSHIKEILFPSDKKLCLLYAEGNDVEECQTHKLIIIDIESGKIDNDISLTAHKPNLIVSPTGTKLLVRDLYRGQFECVNGVVLVDLEVNDVIARLKSWTSRALKICKAQFSEDGNDVNIEYEDKTRKRMICIPTHPPVLMLLWHALAHCRNQGSDTVSPWIQHVLQHQCSQEERERILTVFKGALHL